MPTIQHRTLTRVFMFNGLTLEDALPGQPADAVRRVHALQYAALTNAKIDGPDHLDGREIYTYRVQAGTKG